MGTRETHVICDGEETVVCRNGAGPTTRPHKRENPTLTCFAPHTKLSSGSAGFKLKVKQQHFQKKQENIFQTQVSKDFLNGIQKEH